MIYIQFHFTSHGIAYFKHLLSHFYSHSPAGNKTLDTELLSQEELNTVFDQDTKGFVFKKVFYLYADQPVFDAISSVRIGAKKNIYNYDEKISSQKLKNMWKKVVDEEFASIREEFDFIEKTKSLAPNKQQLFDTWWRNMQHYSIEDQLFWFSNYSNAANIYSKTIFKPVNLSDYGLNDLRNHKQIATALMKWCQEISQKNHGEKFLINISLGSYETQVAWFVLAENNLLPPDTRFISSYDDKTSTDKRFKLFNVREIPVRLFEELTNTVSLFEKTKSLKRELANRLFKQYINRGFSILLLGERGTGKSKLAEEYRGNNFVSQNCAAFDDDSKAETALFGYEKGAFTDAKERKDGLFQQANGGGILFLDEVHLLSKMVQGKLMKALQTDRDNFFRIRRMGGESDEKIKCRVIFASNLPIAELKMRLLPDFYDRISQLIIEIPSLRETPEDREADWNKIWEQLRFGDASDGEIILKSDRKLADWLKKQPLRGNFRDLQKIAILAYSYDQFDDDLKKIIRETSGYNSRFEYVSKEFGKYYIDSADKTNPYLNMGSEPEEMLNNFRRDIADWAVASFGSIPNAYNEFKKINPKTPKAKTLYLWQKHFKE